MKKWTTCFLGLIAVMSVSVVQAEGTVARSVVTTEVVDREPTNELAQVPAGETDVLFFTELRGMAGQTVNHRWIHAGEAVADVSFNVGGPRWRVWSSKKMMPEWEGDWTVQVIDANGEVVAEKQFVYGSAEASAPMTTEGETGTDASSTEGMGEMGTMPEGGTGEEPAPAPETTTE